VEALAHPAIVLPARADLPQARARLHVGARREHLAGPGENGDAHIPAVAHGIEDPGHLQIELGILGIDGRVVHRHDGNAVGDGELDETGLRRGLHERRGDIAIQARSLVLYRP
jgi:hypothetical protein